MSTSSGFLYLSYSVGVTFMLKMYIMVFIRRAKQLKFKCPSVGHLLNT